MVETVLLHVRGWPVRPTKRKIGEAVTSFGVSAFWGFVLEVVPEGTVVRRTIQSQQTATACRYSTAHKGE